MVKLRVQAQHLQPGDIVGSGEKVVRTYILTERANKGKIGVQLARGSGSRCVYWGKSTIIGVERAE